MRMKARKNKPPIPTAVKLIEDQVVLRAREAAVLRMREGDGLTFEEIGQRLGIAVSTVHSDFRRVSDRLVAELDRMFPRWRAEHIMRVAELHQKLLREFEASKRAKVRRRMQRATPNSAKGAEPTVTELQQMDEQDETGEPKFLEQAVRASALLAELLGMTGRGAVEDQDQPAQPQPGMVSGPIIEVSATSLPALPEVRAAIERVQKKKKEKQRLLAAASERKEGTG